MYGLHSKCRQTALTFECSDGETIYMFHLYNLPREPEWYSTFNVWSMYWAAGAKTNDRSSNNSNPWCPEGKNTHFPVKNWVCFSNMDEYYWEKQVPFPIIK